MSLAPLSSRPLLPFPALLSRARLSPARASPERPQSAYLLFSAQRRPGLKAEQPALTFGELAKARPSTRRARLLLSTHPRRHRAPPSPSLPQELGKEWAALSADDKAPWVAAQEVERAQVLALHGGIMLPTAAAKRKADAAAAGGAAPKKAKKGAWGGGQRHRAFVLFVRFSSPSFLFPFPEVDPNAPPKTKKFTAWEVFGSQRRAEIKARFEYP